MTATLHASWLGAWLQHLPAPWLAALDGWSQRVARQRLQARRLRGARKTAPVPPVLTGRVHLPHPWRD